MVTSPASRFAASYTTMRTAHDVADYWAQTHHQAMNKGRHGTVHEDAEGMRACLSHVAAYTAMSTVAVCSVNSILGLGVNWRGILAGQLISSASHYVADRRYLLRRLAARTGRLEFHDTLGGALLLDQSWHRAWLSASALATATIGGTVKPTV